jgi:Flp pilus assembly protein TadD
MPQRTLTAGALTGLLLLTVAVYARGMNGEFQFDDLHTVEFNRNIHHPHNFLTSSAMLDAIHGKRVLTDFTFSINYWVAGPNPFSFHVANLAIHLVTTLLVFFFTRKVLTLSGHVGRDFLAVAVTAVFALHPLQTQAVIYVSQRAESLASGLYLGALLLLLRAEKRGLCPAGVAFYAFSFALFALGLSAKLIVATLPIAYLLLGLLPGPHGLLARPVSRVGSRRASPRGLRDGQPTPPTPRASRAPSLLAAHLRGRDGEAERSERGVGGGWGAEGRSEPFQGSHIQRLGLAAPLFAYALATSVLAVADLKGEDAGFLIPFMPPGRYFLTQWHVVVTYLRLLFWPTGQNLDWDFPLAHGLTDPAVLGSGFFLAVLLVGAGILFVRCRSRGDSAGATGRLVAFGVAWFFLLLAPTSSVVPLADVLMEHRLYLASWGIFLAAAVLASSLVERRVRPGRPVVLAAVLVCLCAGLASASCLRVNLWRSKLALWSDCVAKSPHKARAHLGLGNGYRQAGDVQRAAEEFRDALDLAKEDPRWLRQEIRGKLTSALLVLGRTEEAIVAVQAGLAEQPKDATLLGLLAMAQLQQRNFAAAEAAAQGSVVAAKEPAASLQILGMVRSAEGDREGAIAAFEQAVRIDPEEPQGTLLLARAYREQGRPREACDVLRSPATEQSPQVKEALADCPEP